MNAYGMHYIRTLPFQHRIDYATQIKSLGEHLALVISCSIWYPTEYKCLIVNKNQTLIDMVQHIKDIPNTNLSAFDGVNKDNYALDSKIKNIHEKNDGTRYVHFVVI